MIQMVGKVFITTHVSKFVKLETMLRSNGMLYIVCHLGIGYMLGLEYLKTWCAHQSLIAKIGEFTKSNSQRFHERNIIKHQTKINTKTIEYQMEGVFRSYNHKSLRHVQNRKGHKQGEKHAHRKKPQFCNKPYALNEILKQNSNDSCEF